MNEQLKEHGRWLRKRWLSRPGNRERKQIADERYKAKLTNYERCTFCGKRSTTR